MKCDKSKTHLAILYINTKIKVASATPSIHRYTYHYITVNVSDYNFTVKYIAIYIMPKSLATMSVPKFNLIYLICCS